MEHPYCVFRGITKDSNIVTKESNIVTKDSNIVTKRLFEAYCAELRPPKIKIEPRHLAEWLASQASLPRMHASRSAVTQAKRAIEVSAAFSHLSPTSQDKTNTIVSAT
jgi:hypothetical protein